MDLALNTCGHGTRPCGAARGTLTVIYGCMFSGKTTDLLLRLSLGPPRSIAVFKHIIDDRYRGDAVVSHAGKAVPATPVASASEILNHFRAGTATVGVDEGHFFAEDLIDVVRQLVSRGTGVIVTALDNDSWGRPFPIITRLRTIADEPIAKQGICARCGAVADRTQRFVPVHDDGMVGGAESYEPRCQGCWTPPPADPLT